MSVFWQRAKVVAIVFFAAGSLIFVGLGVRHAMRSDLFRVRQVKIEQKQVSRGVRPPLRLDTLKGLIAVEAGEANLFEVDLDEIESRLLSHPWIRHAKLQKQMPDRLNIAVGFRQPYAILQLKGGKTAYVGEDGSIFDEVHLSVKSDLPSIVGVEESDQKLLRTLIRFVRAWESDPLGRWVRLASVRVNEHRGLDLVVSYPHFGGSARSIRTVLVLGQDFDVQVTHRFKQLHNTFLYLARTQTSARNIRVLGPKKIVVKISSDS